jgi:nucleotidyltransferase/DNA polymerase involved in DNA repair
VTQKPAQNPDQASTVEKVVEELHSRLKLLEEGYGFMVKLMRGSGLLDLAELYEDLKNCSEEYTWVLNKAGKRYYYYYLKCKGKNPRSIYVGKTPEGYNQIRRAASLAHQLKTKIEAVAAALRELERAVEEIRENKAIVEQAVNKIKR